MSKNSDDNIVQALSAIKTLLQSVQSSEKQANPNTLVKIQDALDAKLNQLQSELTEYKESQFTYEFYEELSQAIEAATHIRLSPSFRQFLPETNLISSLNRLTELGQMAVYRHPSLKATLPTSLNARNPATDIAAAHSYAQETTRRSTEATAAAEQASEEAMKLLQRIQEQQKKPTGMVSRDLVDESLRITMDMHVKQAAAVIEADIAATALQELEDLLAKRRSNH